MVRFVSSCYLCGRFVSDPSGLGLSVLGSLCWLPVFVVPFRSVSFAGLSRSGSIRFRLGFAVVRLCTVGFPSCLTGLCCAHVRRRLSRSAPRLAVSRHCRCTALAGFRHIVTTSRSRHLTPGILSPRIYCHCPLSTCSTTARTVTSPAHPLDTQPRHTHAHLNPHSRLHHYATQFPTPSTLSHPKRSPFSASQPQQPQPPPNRTKQHQPSHNKPTMRSTRPSTRPVGNCLARRWRRGSPGICRNGGFPPPISAANNPRLPHGSRYEGISGSGCVLGDPDRVGRA